MPLLVQLRQWAGGRTRRGCRILPPAGRCAGVAPGARARRTGEGARSSYDWVSGRPFLSEMRRCECPRLIALSMRSGEARPLVCVCVCVRVCVCGSETVPAFKYELRRPTGDKCHRKERIPFSCSFPMVNNTFIDSYINSGYIFMFPFVFRKERRLPPASEPRASAPRRLRSRKHLDSWQIAIISIMINKCMYVCVYIYIYIYIHMYTCITIASLCLSV